MISTNNTSRSLAETGTPSDRASGAHPLTLAAEDFHMRAQQLSVREQIERNHFLLERLSAASTRLLQSLDAGDVFAAIEEIIANLIGSEEIAVFHYERDRGTFSPAWSCGVQDDVLQRVAAADGMLRRAVREGASQFRERQDRSAFLAEEAELTACIALRSGREVAGVIAIFGLLPQKQRLEWADFELLKFLEVYGALAIQYQALQQKRTAS